MAETRNLADRSFTFDWRVDHSHPLGWGHITIVDGARMICIYDETRVNAERRAALIVAACNACQLACPENPQAVPNAFLVILNTVRNLVRFEDDKVWAVEQIKRFDRETDGNVHPAEAYMDSLRAALASIET